jgi:hypothetical protein
LMLYEVELIMSQRPSEQRGKYEHSGFRSGLHRLTGDSLTYEYTRRN